MKLKKLKSMLALSLAFSLSLPTGVLAAEPEGQPMAESSLEGTDTQEETPEESGTGTAGPEGEQSGGQSGQDGEGQEQGAGTSGQENNGQDSGNSETGGQSQEGQGSQDGSQEEGTGDGEQEPEAQGETPEAYEARTGYVLPEGYAYILDEKGCVILLEDGSPQIEEKQPGQEGENQPGQNGAVQPGQSGENPSENQEGENQPEQEGEEQPGQDSQPETPEAYEARTGYVLPEGYHYVLDGNGCVILGEDGQPQIEETPADAPASNEELIASQQLMELPVIVEDFRFWTVARKYAFAKENLEIKEEMSQESRTIGSLEKEGLCYVLKEEEGWLYVESGRVRGFVQTGQVLTGEEAQTLLEKYQEQAKDKADKEKKEYAGIEGTAPMAQELVSWKENQAFLYLRATVGQTVVDKDYGVVTASLLNVREGKDTASRIVGTLSQGSLCYILADKEQDWVYVESGDVRGFVSREFIRYGEEIKAQVEQNGEDAYQKAKELIKPEENQACYYTLTSIKSGVPQGELRSSVIAFASQFIGNPYVWGGTSLTEGADCSGFVQSIFKEYGYDLPRVAADQAQYGTKIAVEDAQPGDLIFYAKDGQIYHVVLYAGEGKTIEAMGTKYGIVQGNLNTANAVWATRILEDTQYVYGSGDIGDVNAQPEMYGENLGTFKLTYYCACELCCDVETGITATGTPVIEGQTIAVDPSVIPYGTQVIINGHIFTAEDCGGAIKGNRIDIYVNSHEKANALGVANAEVYLVK
ncbi:MAG: NlpC/P60 family protein [Blautia sp.]